MLNKVQLIGRLGKDPEMKYTSSGDPMVNFTLATSEYGRDREGNRQDRTEWHNISVFGKMAEVCNSYIRKGSLVYLEGAIQTRKYQDKNGNDRYITSINARTVQFLDKKGENSGYDDGYQQQQPRQNAPRQNNNNNNNMSDDDYGSPFPSEASALDDMPF